MRLNDSPALIVVDDVAAQGFNFLHQSRLPLHAWARRASSTISCSPRRLPAVKRFGSLLKNELITGMVLLAPVAGTAYLVYLIVSGIDGLFPEELRPRLFGHPLPGLGVPSVLFGPCHSLVICGAI